MQQYSSKLQPYSVYDDPKQRKNKEIHNLRVKEAEEMRQKLETDLQKYIQEAARYSASICGTQTSTMTANSLATFVMKLEEKYKPDVYLPESFPVIQRLKEDCYKMLADDGMLKNEHIKVINDDLANRQKYIHTMFNGSKTFDQEQTDYEEYARKENTNRKNATKMIRDNACVNESLNVSDYTGKWLAPTNAQTRQNYYQVFKDTNETIHNAWLTAQENAYNEVREKVTQYNANQTQLKGIRDLYDQSWTKTKTDISKTLEGFLQKSTFSAIPAFLKNIEDHIATLKKEAMLNPAIAHLNYLSNSERDIDMENQIKKYQPLCAKIKEFFDDSLLKMQQISCAYKLLTNKEKTETCTDLPTGMPECITDSILTKLGKGVSANDLLLVYDIYLILAKVTNNATLFQTTGDNVWEALGNLATRVIRAAVSQKIPVEIQKLFDIISNATPLAIVEAQQNLHTHVQSSCKPETNNEYCNTLAYAYYMSLQGQIHDKLILPAKALVKEITSYVTSHSQAIAELKLKPILAEPAKYDATQINNATLADQRTYIGYITESINSKKSGASDKLKTRLQAELSAANAVPGGINAYSENKKIIETLLSLEKELDLENAQRANAEQCNLGYLQAKEKLTLAIAALSASKTMQDVTSRLAAVETLRTSVLTMRDSCTKQNVNLKIYDKNNDDVITNASEASRIYSAVSLESLNDTDREILKASLKELESSFNDNILFDVLCRELLEERFKSFLSRRLKPTEVDYWETDFKADLTNGKPVNSFVNLIVTEKYESLKKDKDKITLAQDVAKIVSSSAGADCKDNATLKDVTNALIKRDAELNGLFKEVLQKQLSNLDISVQRCIEAFATTHAFLLAKDGTLKPDTDLVSLGDKLQGLVKACDADKNMPVEITATLKPYLSALLERYNDKSPETIACSLQALLSEMKPATEAAKIIALQIYYETPGVEGDKALQAIEIWPHIDTLVSTNLSCKDGKPANAFVTYKLRDRFSVDELKKIEGVAKRMHEFDDSINNATDNIGEDLVIDDIPKVLMTLANRLRSDYKSKKDGIEAEAERLRQEKEAEAERLRQEQETEAAAEAERLRQVQEAEAAAEAERLRQQKAAQEKVDAEAAAKKKAAANAAKAAVDQLMTQSTNTVVNEAAKKKFDDQLEKTTAEITAAIDKDAVQYTIYEAIDINPSPVIITQFHASIPDDLYAPDFKNPSRIWYKRFARTWSSNILNWRKSKGLEYYQVQRDELDAKYVKARKERFDAIEAFKRVDATQIGGAPDDDSLLAALITHGTRTTKLDDTELLRHTNEFTTSAKFTGPNDVVKIPLSQRNNAAGYNKYYQAVSSSIWMIKMDVVIVADNGAVEWIPWQVMSDFFKEYNVPLTQWHFITKHVPMLSPKEAWTMRLHEKMRPFDLENIYEYVFKNQSVQINNLQVQSADIKNKAYGIVNDKDTAELCKRADTVFKYDFESEMYKDKNTLKDLQKQLLPLNMIESDEIDYDTKKQASAAKGNAILKAIETLNTKPRSFKDILLTNPIPSRMSRVVSLTKGVATQESSTFNKTLTVYNTNLHKWFVEHPQEALNEMHSANETMWKDVLDTFDPTRFCDVMFTYNCCKYLRAQIDLQKELDNFQEVSDKTIFDQAASMQLDALTAWLGKINDAPSREAINEFKRIMKSDKSENVQKTDRLYWMVTKEAATKFYPSTSPSPTVASAEATEARRGNQAPWSLSAFIRINEAAWVLGKQKEFYSELVKKILEALASSDTPDDNLATLTQKMFEKEFDADTKTAVNAVITEHFKDKPVQKWPTAIGEFMPKLVSASGLEAAPASGALVGLFTSKSDGDKLIEALQAMKSVVVPENATAEQLKTTAPNVAAFWSLRESIIEDLRKQGDNWHNWTKAISVSKEWSAQSKAKWLEIFDASFLSSPEDAAAVDASNYDAGSFFNTAYKLIAEIDSEFKSEIAKKRDKIKYTNGEDAVPLPWHETQLQSFSSISMWLTPGLLQNDKDYARMSKLTQSGKPAVILWTELKTLYAKIPQNLYKAYYYTIWMNLFGRRVVTNIATEILKENTLQPNTSLLAKALEYHKLHSHLYNIVVSFMANHPGMSWTNDTYKRVKTIVEFIPDNNPNSSDVNYEPFAAVKEWETRHPTKSVTMTNTPQPINNA